MDQGVNKMSKEITKTENTKLQVKDIGQAAITNMASQVSSFAELSGTPLTPQEKSNAVNMIISIMKTVSEKEFTDPKTKVSRPLTINDCDVVGCQLPQQIKRYARLGLSMAEGEVFLDCRNNKHSNLMNISLKKQYQGVRKELIKFCSKKIVRFYSDVICTGDVFEKEVDFSTGYERVVKHDKNKDIDRNKLENIIGAYEIAYVEENGQLVQYVAEIDKNRINRAYNAATTKNVWNADTARMVLKTASWVMYNNVLKPYMVIPEDLKDDWEETNDKEYDFEQEKVVASEETIENTSSGELVDIPFDEDGVVVID